MLRERIQTQKIKTVLFHYYDNMKNAKLYKENQLIIRGCV